MNKPKKLATMSQKLISINRLKRTAEALLKVREIADRAADCTILTNAQSDRLGPTDADQTRENDFFTEEEATQIFDWALEIGMIRDRYVKFANDLHQRLQEQKTAAGQPKLDQEFLNR